MRTICLTTPQEDPTRHAAAQAHFQEMGVHAEFIQGLHKETSGLTTDHPYMVDRGPGSPDEHVPFYIGKHPVNIWIGHWMIWNALLLSGDREWFVVECDAKFQVGWGKHFAMALLAAPRGYDLIYMGSCCTNGRPKESVSATWSAPPMYDGGTTHGLYRLAGTAPQCNHAYVVTREAARILTTRLRQVWAPIDIQQASECWGDRLPRSPEPFGVLERPLNVYTVLPRIVGQWNTEIPE